MRAASLGWARRSPLPAVAAIVLLALLLRVGTVVLTPDYQVIYDSADYHRHGVSIAHGNGFPGTLFAAGGGPSAFRPPLFPYLLGGVYAATGDSVGAGRLVEAILGAIAVGLVYLVGVLGWGRRVGLVAAGLAAVFPPLVLLDAALVSEPLFLVLELAAVLAVLLYRRSRHLGWAASAGIACGLGVLARSNGLLIVLPLLVGVWWPFRRQDRRSLVAAGLVLAATALTIAPWTLRNAHAFHRFVPVTTQSGLALAGEYNDRARTFPGYPATWVIPWRTARYAPLYRRTDLDEAELDSALSTRARAYLLHHPGYAAQAIALNTLRLLELAPTAPYLEAGDLRQRGLSRLGGQVVRYSFYAGCLLALLGIAHLARQPRGRRGPLFAWLIPPLMVAAAAPLLGSPRYRTPADPFVVLAAAIGLTALLSRDRGVGREAETAADGAS